MEIEELKMIDTLIKLDGDILLWIQDNLRADWLDPIIKAITYLGNGGIFWILVCILLMLIKKTRATGAVCSCSLAVTFLINNLILKNVIARVRPYEAIESLTRIIGAQSDFSFPSGHSGASFAVAVVIFMEMPKKYGIPAVILAFLIALSRLYVGVHYPSDVIAGIATGTVYAVICVMVYRKFFKDRRSAVSEQNETN